MITVNGKEYKSLNDVPEEFKVIFGDKNNNGIPDFVEGLLNTADLKKTAPMEANFSTFFYDGKQYSSIDALPPEAKEKVKQGFSKLEKSGMGAITSISSTDSSTQQSFEQEKLMDSIQAKVNEGKIPESLQQEAQQELRPGFKFRVAMTIVFFFLALIYILWLLKMVPW